MNALDTDPLPHGDRAWRRGRIARSAAAVFLLLFAGSALLNVLVGLAHGYRASPAGLDHDEFEYLDLSGQILAGHWDLGSRRTILFPAIIAGLRAIDDNFLFVQIAVSIIAALAAPLLYAVVVRLCGSARLGLAAGILMALWPAQLFNATSLYSETVALPCFLLVLLALPLGSRAIRADWRQAAGPGGAVVAGLMLGIAAHVRPMYLLFLPFALIIPFVEDGSLRRAGRTALLVAASFAVVVLPWSVWKSSQYGQVIVLTSNGGETLAGGLNARLAGMANTPIHLAHRDTWLGPGKWLQPIDTGYLSPVENHLSYETQARLLQQRSLAWIEAHPGEAAWLEACKLGYMWGLYPWRGESPIKLLFGNLPVVVLLGFAAVALALRPRRWLGLVRLWSVPLFTSGVALISWGSWRFRQPADAALLAFLVIVSGWWLRKNPTDH